MSEARKSVFTIPAGVPFAKTLAKKLFEDNKDQPESLADIMVLLPTRRACRVVREAFLQVSNGKALILPRLQAIGDVDEEELSLNLAGTDALNTFLELPASISPLKRQILLARLIQSAETFTQGFDHALLLASALGRFMDQIYTENLELSALAELVPEDFAEHWQITLDFLKILSKSWPKILKEESVIDIADRRNRLILALANYWENSQPEKQIIAAGTTGSIPAVAKLLSVISTLPNGHIILPGLDQDIDEESWDALNESYPQFGLKQLLGRMNVKREHVRLWHDHKEHSISESRRVLCREIMRPAETTHKWTDIGTNKTLQTTLSAAQENLKWLECADERQEAQTIAILMREILESPRKTAALITPDRNLARRVSAACNRWGIKLDDSAGQSLNQTNVGSFFNLLIKACNENLSPIALLSLLKHSLCRAIKNKDVQQLEMRLLRGIKPAGGIEGLRKKLETCDVQQQDEITQTLNKLEEALGPLSEVMGGKHTFKSLITQHAQAAENLAKNTEILWQNEEGEALSTLLSNLLEHAHYMPEVTAETYAEILSQIMSSITVRPKYGTHPRLKILGQLEARLIDADLVIMAGLNEGTWPPDAAHDPWLSRPMRKEFGLPAHERSVGLAAHDFVQGFCSANVVLTRSKRGGGAPTIPARWLQRLSTVLDAAKLSKEDIQNAPHKIWATNIDQANDFKPCTRPEPRPPIAARPQELPATQIETWLKDPYGVYARYVLKLKALDPLEQQADAALRGTLLHDVLEQFVTAHPADIPENALETLHIYAENILSEQDQKSEIWQFWWPRFERLSHWFVEYEKYHRKTHRPLKAEIQGSATINNFTVTARADRIDLGPQGAVIIDYKSAGTYSKKSMHTGDAPQLPIEALILEKNGFDGITSKKTEALEYWTLSGKAGAAGKITAERDEIEALVKHTQQSLETLIDAFKDEHTPYYALPREGYAPRFNDYEHLARVKEWATLGETENSGKVA